MKLEAQALDNAVDQYMKWLLEGAHLRYTATLPLVPKEHREKVTTVWKPILIARELLLQKAEALIRKLD